MRLTRFRVVLFTAPEYQTARLILRSAAQSKHLEREQQRVLLSHIYLSKRNVPTTANRMSATPTIL